MRSERQQKASRANGAKSRGPTTPEGKARSSCNSVVHGLLASTIVLEEENRATFEQMQAEITTEFAPSTPFESTLVCVMLAARWRSFRILGMECAELDFAIRTTPQTGLDTSTRGSRAMHQQGGDVSEGLLRRYEAHYERLHNRAFNLLVKYRQLSGTIFAPRPVDDDQPAPPPTPPPPPPAPEPQPEPVTETPQPKLATWHKNRNKNRAKRRREAANFKVRSEPNTAPAPGLQPEKGDQNHDPKHPSSTPTAPAPCCDSI